MDTRRDNVAEISMVHAAMDDVIRRVQADAKELDAIHEESVKAYEKLGNEEFAQ